MRKVYFNMAILLFAGSLALSAHALTQNLYSTLDYYGFTDEKQKNALVEILQLADVPNSKDFISKQTISKHELAKQILNLAKETQDRLTVRKGAQERWDVETSAWMKDPAVQTKVMQDLNTLDMLDPMPPKFYQNDAICILGSTNNTMAARLKFAEDLYSHNKLTTKWLVLLVGERYVSVNKPGAVLDGTEEQLTQIALKAGKDRQSLTETDLMRALYANTKFAQKFKDNTVVIDTPKGELPRPTTETTVQAFCQWLQSHPQVTTVTFVSNQPHVAYQKAIIEQVLVRNNVDIKFDVIGPKFNIASLPNKDDQVNYLLQALGSRIWAATPLVLKKVGADLNDPTLNEQYLALFKKQPLIYKAQPMGKN